MLPSQNVVESRAVSKYYYYQVSDYHDPETFEPKPNAEGQIAAAQEYSYIAVSDTPVGDYKPDYDTHKVRSINVKQSNYFNAI
jgi:hypothetical protein